METENQVTVAGYISAGGQVLPPMVIWNRKKAPPQLAEMEFPKQFMAYLPTVGSIRHFSISGFENILHYTPTDRPLILLLAGHSSHYCPVTIKLAVEGGVIIFTPRPHSSHISQPLDKGMYGPL